MSGKVQDLPPADPIADPDIFYVKQGGLDKQATALELKTYTGGGGSGGGGGIATFATHGLMAANNPSGGVIVGTFVALAEEARIPGWFIVDLAGNWTTAIAADTQKGIFVPSTVDPTKVYRRILDGPYVNFKFFGYKDDDASGAGTDNADVLAAAGACLRALRLTGSKVFQYGNGVSLTLLITGAGYYSHRVSFDWAVHIKGLGGTIGGGSGTQMRCPANTGCLYMDHGSAGWVVEGIWGEGGWNPADAGPAGDEGEYHFLEWKNKGTWRDINGEKWQGSLLRGNNDAATSGGLDNSNSMVGENAFAQYCRSTIENNGGDVNDCRFESVKGISNRQCVVYEHGFFGATYPAAEGEANGYVPGWVNVGAVAARPACMVWDNNGGSNPGVWNCIGGNEVWCRTNRPPAAGDHNQGWIKNGVLSGWSEAIANSEGIPTWINNGYYRPGNATVIHQGDSNHSTFPMLYNESDQICQFDLNVGEITGIVDPGHAISVNASTGTYFTTTLPPVDLGGQRWSGYTILGPFWAKNTSVEYGAADLVVPASASDIVHQYFSPASNTFLQFNSHAAGSWALDAAIQASFSSLALQGRNVVTLSTFSGAGVRFDGTEFYPLTDNNIALGQSSLRWSTVYAGTGTINTSDERQKDLIDKIDDKVLDAWGDVQWMQFKFKDAIAAKKSKARLHFGLVAQHVYDVFKKHGLDGFKYGLLCYDKWDDQFTEVQEEVEELLKFEIVTKPAHRHRITKRRIPAKKKTVTRKIKTMRVKVDEEGKAVMRLSRAAGYSWGLRHDEAHALEAAYHRRESQVLAARVTKLESLLEARHGADG